MKILFVVPRFHINLSYQLEALQQAGYTVSLAVLYRGGSESVTTITPKIVGTRFSPQTIPSPRRLLKIIAATQPDVVFVRGFRSWFTLITILMVRLRGKRLFLLVQTDKHDGGGVYRQAALFLLTKVFGVARIISPLQNARPTHNDVYAYAPFVISKAPCTAHPSSEGVIRIMTVGKFQSRKGHLLLLDVCNRLVTESCNVHLTIVGQLYDAQEAERIHHFIDHHGLQERVTILTDLSHHQVRELYCEHDLFVLPSWNEPAAFSPLEAMAAGLPVIVSDTCGTKCYVREGVNGLVFKSQDVDDLYNKVRDAVTADLTQWGIQSLQSIKEQHSPERYVHSINSILKS